MTKITDWTGAYDLPWKGLLWEDKETGESAFSHPAKMARGLCLRIIEYALQNGLIESGQIVLDPFGGVGTTALPCLANGLNYIGVELESRFVEMGRKNIELWNAKFSSMPRWVGYAVLLQGDSRRLAEVIAGAGLVVSSPPYAEAIQNGKSGIDKTKGVDPRNPDSLAVRRIEQLAEGYGVTPGQLGAMKSGDITAVIASPPFAGNTGGRGEASRNGIDAALFDRHSGGMKKGTGSDPANLDHLPMGTVTAVIASPPYAETLQRPNGIDASKINRPGGKNSQSVTDPRYGSSNGQLGAMVVGSPPFAGSIGSDDPAKRGGLLVSDPKRAGDTNLTGSYGQSDGQLGAMVVGSPPFENSIAGGTAKQTGILGQQANGINGTSGGKLARSAFQDYGSTPGQIGTESGETFWAAARTILEQCHQILPDNAAAIWVVKAYVKNGKLVDFPGQWQALCEACGFETIEVIRAWLVKKNGEQAGIANGHDTSATITNLMGEEITKEGEAITDKSKDVARKSFFRRLAEKNGSPPIDYETVLVTRKKGLPL